MNDTSDASVKAAADKIRALRTPAPPVAAVAPPATPPETPPAQAEDPKGPERGDDGKFKRKEMSEAEKGLLSAARAEREKRKVVESTVADLKRELDALKASKPSASADRRADLLKKAPEETQKFWGEVADPVVRQTVDEEIEKRLAAYAPALEAYQKSQAKEVAATSFRNDLVEFAEDMALEGVQFDPAELVNVIHSFENDHGIILGSTNAVKFKNALNILADRRAVTKSPEVEAAAKAKQAAEAKVRAGGVSPQTTNTPPAPNQSGTLQATVKDLAKKGDYREIAHILRDKIRARPAYQHPLGR